MKDLLITLVAILFLPRETRQLQSLYMLASEEDTFKQYHFDGMTLYTPKPVTLATCLISCTITLSTCVSIKLNTTTKQCLGFRTHPIFDEHGSFHIETENTQWTTLYPGKNNT